MRAGGTPTARISAPDTTELAGQQVTTKTVFEVRGHSDLIARAARTMSGTVVSNAHEGIKAAVSVRSVHQRARRWSDVASPVLGLF